MLRIAGSLILRHHGPELEHLETHPIQANSLLRKQDGPRGGQLDTGCDQQHQRRAEEEGEQGKPDVKYTLSECVAHRVHRVGAYIEKGHAVEIEYSVGYEYAFPKIQYHSSRDAQMVKNL